MSQLRYNKMVEKSIDRLRAMGLKLYIEAPNDDEVYIVIDIKSIMNMISRKISYPQHKLYREGDYVIIKIWRER